MTCPYNGSIRILEIHHKKFHMFAGLVFTLLAMVSDNNAYLKETIKCGNGNECSSVVCHDQG